MVDPETNQKSRGDILLLHVDQLCTSKLSGEIMPKHKQWLNAKKPTGKKTIKVRRSLDRSIKICWLLIIDARCRKVLRPPTNSLQV